MSGYQEALEAAGATVHCYEESGGYQGTWVAKVTYKGETGWIKDCYGSCTGCDAFEAEFGWTRRGDYETRLKAFGEEYLNRLMTHEELLKELQGAYDRWPHDEEGRLLEFVKAN